MNQQADWQLRQLSVNHESDIAVWEKPDKGSISISLLFLLPLFIIIANLIEQHIGWGIEGERSAWRTFGAAKGHKGTKKRGEPSKSKDVWGVEMGLELVDKEVLTLLDLPEELLELLGKYLDVTATLALASTCSYLQARIKKS